MQNTADYHALPSGCGHDIRTHLHVLLSAIQMIEEGKLSSDKLKEYYEIIRKNAHAMLRLVNHLVDDPGTVKSTAKCFYTQQIDGLLCSIADSFRPFAQSKQLELLMDIACPIHLYCDVEMIERVMFNLLSNAVKFTEPGGFIYLSARHAGDVVEINVADTGRGLSKELVDQICNCPTANVGTVGAIGTVGAGMGLSLVKSLMDSLYGTISVTSRENVGTTFYLRFPSAERALETYFIGEKLALEGSSACTLS